MPNAVVPTLSSDDSAWKPLEEYEAAKRESHEKPYCAHPRGTWCTCRKFMSKSPKTSPPSSTTGHNRDAEEKCRLCGYAIKHPEFAPPPHDAHGACLIEEGHYFDGAYGGGE